MRDLRPSDSGKKFTAKLFKVPVEGKIYYDEKEGEYFLCQNSKEGSKSPDKLGYECSWSVYCGKLRDQKRNNVSDLRIERPTKEEIEVFKDFSKGDVLIKANHSYHKTVIEQLGKILFTEDSDDGSIRLCTAEGSYNIGWRLNIETKEEESLPVEMSVKEVAERLGLDPKTLKIVDK